MTLMRWFRRNNKKILVGVLILVMIVFVGGQALTAVLKSAGHHGNPAIGYLVENGQRRPIRRSDWMAADLDLRILRALDIDKIAQAGFFWKVPQLRSILGDAEPVPVMAANALLFGDQRSNQATRALLQRQALQWAPDREALAALQADIKAVTGTDPAQAPLYFLLLLREARQAGLRATPPQIDALLDVRGQLVAAQRLPAVSLAQVVQRTAGTERGLRAAIGAYVTILRYAHVLSKGLFVSGPQLRRAVCNAAEIRTVAGDYVTFDARFFLDRVADPDPAALTAQFNAFKSAEPGEYSDENPHGFGYKLPDRVQVEYLRIDLARVEDTVKAEFARLSILEQEKRIRDYWENNRAQFRVPVQPKDTAQSQSDSADTPRYRDPPFDEVAGRARQLWLEAEARRRAERVLADARRLSREATAAAAAPPKGAPVVSNYQDIARRLSTDKIPITHARTAYLSQGEAARYQDFGSTFLMRGNRPEKALLTMLYDQCAALQAGESDRLVGAPIQLNEDIGPLVALDRRSKAQAVYIVRITGADRAREPQSLDDDGSAGPAGAEAAAAHTSKLREQVARDVRWAAAFELAQQWAHRFAQRAADDWDTALAWAQKSLAEPNQPAPPLLPDSLGSVRERVDQLQNMMAQGKVDQPRMRAFLAESATLLQRAVELAQERRLLDAKELAVLPLPYYNKCYVFKNLRASMPSENEYLQRRPLAAYELILREHAALALAHFNPDNIKKRCHFEREAKEPAEKDG